MADMTAYLVLVLFMLLVGIVSTAIAKSEIGRRIAEFLGFGDEPEWMN